MLRVDRRKRNEQIQMNQQELKELIDLVIEKGIAEFELEREDVKVRIKRAGDQTAPAVQYIPAPVIGSSPLVATASGPAAAPAAAPAGAGGAEAAQPAREEDGLQSVKSPIVGTFYESPSPGAPAFVKSGDQVEVGQVLCIIEAMKLMNEIESEYAGEVVKRLVQNGQPVEYGQPLFAIRPRS
jgi:acetyl-CoA carboxylase biotin carboxyl carrier protein